MNKPLLDKDILGFLIFTVIILLSCIILSIVKGVKIYNKFYQQGLGRITSFLYTLVYLFFFWIARESNQEPEPNIQYLNKQVRLLFLLVFGGIIIIYFICILPLQQ